MNQHPEYLLNKIKSPADIKVLDLEEMKQLSSEIRHLIIEKDAAVGGHLSPDLGIVELTIAYHYVFDAPGDKIIWDVLPPDLPPQDADRSGLCLAGPGSLRLKVTSFSVLSYFFLFSCSLLLFNSLLVMSK